MKTQISLIALLLVLLLFGCNNSNTSEYTSIKEHLKTNKPHPGKKLMETNCYICHSPTADHDSRIGPPMIAIKKHYINKNTTKEEFIKDMQEWIKNPTEENAKMPGAVRRFGVMPKTPYPEVTIEQIADYMFDNKIEQPDWFEEHFNGERGRHNNKRKGNL